MRKCYCSQWPSFVLHGERHCGDMSCEITVVDDLRTDPPTRKCSTSSTNSTRSTNSTTSAGSMATSDGDVDAAAVAIPSSAVVVYVTDDTVAAMSVVGCRGDRTRGTVANVDASSSDIHTDRDECSSDDSCNGPDSPTGLKRVGSVYDFGLDGADSPPPCANHPFATGPDADLTKVARKQLRMIREVDVAVCHLNHTNTIISKILSSKYLRRWENHQIRLQDDCITSSTVSDNKIEPILC